MRKFTFGNNGVDFTHDALIKYQAMICELNIHLLGIRIKPSFPGRLRLISLGRSFDQGLSSVKDALQAALSLTDENLWPFFNQEE